MPQVLVAGIGNIFFGDDGFGVEVAHALSETPLPPSVRVADFGIRGMHLAFELLEREYDTTILVDAAPRGGRPGTLYVIEPDLDADRDDSVPADAHGMSPQAVFALCRSLGGTTKRTVIVACEPACIDEGIGLSEPVSLAVGEAVRLIQSMVQEETGTVHVSGYSGEDRRARGRG